MGFREWSSLASKQIFLWRLFLHFLNVPQAFWYSNVVIWVKAILPNMSFFYESENKLSEQFDCSGRWLKKLPYSSIPLYLRTYSTWLLTFWLLYELCRSYLRDPFKSSLNCPLYELWRSSLNESLQDPLRLFLIASSSWSNFWVPLKLEYFEFKLSLISSSMTPSLI